MGYGLGKTSPVVLSFGKDNYEALIERHGQFIRWRISSKCPCTDKHTMQPDPQCPHCGGLGFTYSHQNKMIITHEAMTDGTNVIEIQEEYADCSLNFVYGFGGTKYAAKKHGQFVILETPPQKGTYLTLVMEQDTVKKLPEADCENAGGGYFRVIGLQFRRTGIEGVYHTAPGDIEKIEKIIDAAGREYEAVELRTDLFRIEPRVEIKPGGDGNETEEVPPIAEPIKVIGVYYIPPFIFALLSQNLSKEDASAMIECHGDALLTFPYNCDVSEDDILTALSGTYTQKEVVKRVEGSDDTIGAYFVTDIVSCMGKRREYKAGIDFILAGTNYIRWMCEDAPLPGDAYSLTYRICPTYKVVKNIPQIRTSENQRLPKKAVVQLFDTYGEQRRANQQ
jgi:hypothetical protein